MSFLETPWYFFWTPSDGKYWVHYHNNKGGLLVIFRATQKLSLGIGQLTYSLKVKIALTVFFLFFFFAYLVGKKPYSITWRYSYSTIVTSLVKREPPCDCRKCHGGMLAFGLISCHVHVSFSPGTFVFSVFNLPNSGTC